VSSQKKLIYHFEAERINYKRGKGEVDERWEGDTRASTILYTHQDWRWIYAQADAALERGEGYDLRLNIVPFKYVENRAEICMKILDSGASQLEAPIFPHLNEMQKQRGRHLSEEQLLSYCSAVLRSFLTSYKAIVERNFPTLTPGFRLYTKMPLICFLSVRAGLPRQGPMIFIQLCKAREQLAENQVISCSGRELESADHKVLWYQGQTYEVIEGWWRSWHDFVYGSGSFSDAPISSSTVLRELVYTQISREMGRALNLLFANYGIHYTKRFQPRKW
jgi:hypothetical protein